ncbi:Erg28 protein [Starmerella bacillaris]|uniref:Erg28 protein n=1 Tax=Starmerella bacillaris TaxID=1247836 RepID=A0AAV5RNJ8_STABA|nr:Erg28 protein [Starmerella bacillaris]
MVSIPSGLLPKWMLLISAVSIFNSIQCYLGDLSLSRRVYNNKPNEVTPLSNRTFGTWTAAVAVIRFYAAYNLSNPAVYSIAYSTFLIAGFHFLCEWLVFRTTNLGKGLLGPLFVAGVTSVWMYYVKGQY